MVLVVGTLQAGVYVAVDRNVSTAMVAVSGAGGVAGDVVREGGAEVVGSEEVAAVVAAESGATLGYETDLADC